MIFPPFQTVLTWKCFSSKAIISNHIKNAIISKNHIKNCCHLKSYKKAIIPNHIKKCYHLFSYPNYGLRNWSVTYQAILSLSGQPYSAPKWLNCQKNLFQRMYHFHQIIILQFLIFSTEPFEHRIKRSFVIIPKNLIFFAKTGGIHSISKKSSVRLYSLYENKSKNQDSDDDYKNCH